MTFLVHSCFLQVSSYSSVLSDENLAVIGEPIQYLNTNFQVKFNPKTMKFTRSYLFDVLLEQPQGQPLVQFDLFCVPFLFQRPVVV